MRAPLYNKGSAFSDAELGRLAESAPMKRLD
jgi:hypothetical protein